MLLYAFNVSIRFNTRVYDDTNFLMSLPSYILGRFFPRLVRGFLFGRRGGDRTASYVLNILVWTRIESRRRSIRFFPFPFRLDRAQARRINNDDTIIIVRTPADASSNLDIIPYYVLAARSSRYRRILGGRRKTDREPVDDSFY